MFCFVLWYNKDIMKISLDIQFNLKFQSANIDNNKSCQIDNKTFRQAENIQILDSQKNKIEQTKINGLKKIISNQKGGHDYPNAYLISLLISILASLLIVISIFFPQAF